MSLVSTGRGQQEVYTPKGGCVVTILRVAVLVFSFVNATHAQSAAALARKYATVTSYEVRPGVFMTPTVSPQGKVCKMTVERHHLHENVLDSDTVLSDELIHELIDELAPSAQRGKELTGIDLWFGSEDIIGSLAISRKTYENASVEIYGDTHEDGSSKNLTLVIFWKNSGCKATQNAARPR
jgi:hypothetical protein